MCLNFKLLIPVLFDINLNLFSWALENIQTRKLLNSLICMRVPLTVFLYINNVGFFGQVTTLYSLVRTYSSASKTYIKCHYPVHSYSIDCNRFDRPMIWSNCLSNQNTRMVRNALSSPEAEQTFNKCLLHGFWMLWSQSYFLLHYKKFYPRCLDWQKFYHQDEKNMFSHVSFVKSPTLK